MKSLFYISVVSSIFAGLLIPQLSRISFLIPYFISIILCFSYLDIELKIKNLFRIETIVTLLLSIVIMPVIAFFILSYSLPDDIRAGILLVSCVPTGIMTLIISPFLPESDKPLILTNFIILTTASMLYIPVLLGIFSGIEIEIDRSRIFLQTVAIIAAPYAVSRLIRLMKNIAVPRLKKISDVITPILIFLIISSSIGRISGSYTLNFTLLHILISVLLIYILQGAFGYWGGRILRKGRKIANTMAFISSSRNVQLGFAIAILNFPPATVIPLIAGIIGHHILNIFWVWRLGR